MKNLSLFLLIMIICGSLTKAPVVPCGTEIRADYYLKGKLMHTDKIPSFSRIREPSELIECQLHWKYNLKFMYDSIRFSVNIKK